MDEGKEDIEILEEKEEEKNEKSMEQRNSKIEILENKESKYDNLKPRDELIKKEEQEEQDSEKTIKPANEEKKTIGNEKIHIFLLNIIVPIIIGFIEYHVTEKLFECNVNHVLINGSTHPVPLGCTNVFPPYFIILMLILMNLVIGCIILLLIKKSKSKWVPTILSLIISFVICFVISDILLTYSSEISIIIYYICFFSMVSYIPLYFILYLTRLFVPSKKKKIFLIISSSIIIVASIIGTYIDCSINRNDNMSYKPIIYIYPTEDKKIEIKVSHPENLTVTYPKYENSWKVFAKEDGTLIDKNGRSYYALYWEGKNSKINKIKEDGFIVRGEEVAHFLEEKLEILGLNEREANEFIVYWLPQLEKNEYNYIRFQTREEIERSMSLNITPEPDTLIRVMMEYKPLKKKIKVKEQKLEIVERQGYTVVEWSGTEIR